MKRNQFIKTITATAIGLPVVGKSMRSDTLTDFPCIDKSNSWATIKKQYPKSKQILDLNHAGLNMTPKPVLKAHEKYKEMMRLVPSLHQRELWKVLKVAREKIAFHVGCSYDEIALVTNTTEAMDTAINGIKLKKGSEVILGFYDYPHIRFQWEAKARRDKLKLKYVDIGPYPKSKDEIISKYIKAVTPRTRVLQLTHIINYNGVLVPCQEIIDLLPEHVTYKIVDGAQSVSHVPVDLHKMKCTHFGSSLHKWSGAAFGTGFLYVQKDFIAETQPLFPCPENKKNFIEKFHSSGSRDYSDYATIVDSMMFQSQFTMEEKKNRLLYLKKYWQERCRVFKPYMPDESIESGIGIIPVENPSKIVNHLLNEHIHVAQLDRGELHAIRISPNLCHDEKDLDCFLKALNAIRS